MIGWKGDAAVVKTAVDLRVRFFIPGRSYIAGGEAVLPTRSPLFIGIVGQRRSIVPDISSGLLAHDAACCLLRMVC